MQSNLSKLYVALAAAGLCAGISATSFAGCGNKFPVTVPVNTAQFHLGLTGLYAKSTSDDLVYAGTGDLFDNGGNATLHSLDPDYCFGWRVDAGYFMPGCGNDVSFNWTYFSSDDDCTVTGADVFSRFVPFENFNKVHAESDITLNEVNMELGQAVDFCCLHTRFHFGLSYASLESCIDSKGVANMVEQSPGFSGKVHVESNFWGIGPRFGADLNYPLGSPCSQFSVISHAAGALLAGEICTEQKGTFTTGEGTGSFKADIDDTCTIVPAGEFKFGVRYATNAGKLNCPGYSAELGWQANVYLNSLNHGFSATSFGSSTNYGQYGWYLTLGYAG